MVFLREGVVMGRFPELIDDDLIARWACSEPRDILASNYVRHKAAQTSMWLKNVTVGSLTYVAGIRQTTTSDFLEP